MKINSTKTARHLALLLASTLVLSACSDDDDPVVEEPEVTPPAPVVSSYDITITNLTSAQPLSPAAIVLHSEGRLWTLGETASEELEYLAEGGDNSFLLALPVVAAGESGLAPIAPGGSETISISIEDNDMPLLSVVTMLVNTNDAFTGINAQSLAQLAVGESWSSTTLAYDSGTEANSEVMGTIPGPVDMGVGFDAARDDVDFVAMHPGIVSVDDGLSTSVLSKLHGFDNPIAKIQVTRTE
ncbi:spondin domain-containing protein [Planctobacterium marinum]|uniref:Spondin domain-containing protein n=1 Tax=Planctobacterium marinum TaxID=1631968 RepID=A0AA48HM10_9ALTE|nr:hypothetical protein MACH26_04680 [Planctobacterium marinum]